MCTCALTFLFLSVCNPDPPSTRFPGAWYVRTHELGHQEEFRRHAQAEEEAEAARFQHARRQRDAGAPPPRGHERASSRIVNLGSPKRLSISKPDLVTRNPCMRTCACIMCPCDDVRMHHVSMWYGHMRMMMLSPTYSNVHAHMQACARSASRVSTTSK